MSAVVGGADDHAEPDAVSADFETVERLAADLCNRSGGQWDRKRTRRNLWRKRALALVALANGNKAEALRVMRGGK